MPPAWTHSALWFRERFVSSFLSSHRRTLWYLLLWLRCCLGICLFWDCCDCSSQLFCRDLWDSRHLSGVAVMHIDAAVMSTLFFADLIPGMSFTPLNSSSILWMSCCLFNLFFVSDTFFKHLLTSFSCFSSLGVFLLSSIVFGFQRLPLILPQSLLLLLSRLLLHRLLLSRSGLYWQVTQ